jgi:transcriptional regulator with XRE-family HTH domain
MPRRVCDELDRIIGANIRRRRIARKMTQAEISGCLSVTPQQVQKYERGESSIAAIHLIRLAVKLNCQLEDFLRLN